MAQTKEVKTRSGAELVCSWTYMLLLLCSPPARPGKLAFDDQDRGLRGGPKAGSPIKEQDASDDALAMVRQGTREAGQDSRMAAAGRAKTLGKDW